MRLQRQLWIASVLAPAACVAPTSASPGVYDTCGVDAVRALAWLLDKPVGAEQVATWYQAARQRPVSLADLVGMAGATGLPCRAVRATLEELLERDQVAIVHLREPDHFALLLDASTSGPRLFERVASIPRTVALDELRSRYTGHALILDVNASAQAPRVVCPKRAARVRATGVGQVIEAEFQIHNGGASLLHLRMLGKSCGCTTTMLDTAALEPGRDTAFAMKVTVPAPGTQSYWVRLGTNDPCRPALLFTLTAESPFGTQLYPGSLALGGEPGSVLESVLRLDAPAGTTLDSVECSVPGVETALEQYVDAGEWVRFLVRVVATVPQETGAVTGHIALHTNLVDSPVLMVPLRLSPLSRWTADPPSAFFGFVKAGAVATTSIRIRRTFAHQGVLGTATCSDRRVRVVSLERLDEGTWLLRLSLDTAAAGAVNAAIEVSAGGSDGGGLTIPASALVQQ